nr:MaoC/PaaZ C-terminal domain-containing protein [Actinoplanes rishiriensis]
MLPTRRPSTLPDRTLTQSGVRVDLAHLAAYDRVCGFRLSDTLPATYPHLLAFPLAMRLMVGSDFPFPVIGLVHVANRITARSVRADAELDIAVHADNLRPHAKGRQFDVVAVASHGGSEVWRGVSTYLSRSASSAGASPAGASPAGASPAGTSPAGTSPAGTSPAGASPAAGGGRGPASTFHPPPASAIWRVPPRTGTDYAEVSGDHNPIHTSRIGARLFGFPKPIAHGMWTKARCLAALEGRLPGEYTVDVAFKQPILLPARVSFHAAPTGTGWEFRVDGKRPHLAGVVTPP